MRNMEYYMLVINILSGDNEDHILAAQSSAVCSASWKAQVVSIWPWRLETHQVGGTCTPWCLRKSTLDSADSRKIVGLPCSLKHLSRSYVVNSSTCEGLLGKDGRKDAGGSEYHTWKGPEAAESTASRRGLKKALVAQGQRAKESEPWGEGRTKRGRPGRLSHKRL